MSFLIIKNESGGVNIENTNTLKERFYGANVYEPELIENKIYVRKVPSNERDINFLIVGNIASVTSIDDNGTSIAVPATMQELYAILRGFFLTNRDENLLAQLKYKIISMPLEIDVNGDYIVYTGFSTDYEALLSEAKWAVKKQHEDGSQQWAGKLGFDEILNDYLTLTYS
jgi:hypothetical protein